MDNISFCFVFSNFSQYGTYYFEETTKIKREAAQTVVRAGSLRNKLYVGQWTGGKQDRKDTGQDGCRTIRLHLNKCARMDRRKTTQEGCTSVGRSTVQVEHKKGGMQERKDTGIKGCIGGGMHERRDAGY